MKTLLMIGGVAAFVAAADLHDLGTPDPVVIVRHEVADYDTWRRAFDGALPIRRDMGERSFRILKDDADPKNVTALFIWSTRAAAQAFARSDLLADGMSRSGVVSEPQILILDGADGLADIALPATAYALAEAHRMAGR